MELVTLLGSLISSVTSRLVADELKAWSPSIVQKLISMAVAKLPETNRERFSEEWQSDLDSIPGDLSKIVYALGLISAAAKISIQLKPENHLSIQTFAKRSVDFIVAAAALWIVAPLMLCIAISIKLTSSGPVLLRHHRGGENGRPFGVLKFRTMYWDHSILEDYLAHIPEVKEAGNQRHVAAKYLRVTPIGQFLRKTSLEELPQILNVLSGKMSLVGPYPGIALEGTSKEYLTVKPGLTGLWQLSNSSDYQEKIRLDRYYAENRSFWGDIKILVLTVISVFRGD